MWPKVAVLLTLCVCTLPIRAVVISSEGACHIKIASEDGSDESNFHAAYLDGTLYFQNWTKIKAFIKNLGQRPRLEDEKRIRELEAECRNAIELLAAAAIPPRAIRVPLEATPHLGEWVIADFNGDGRDDSIVVSGTGYYLQLQQADGSLAERARIEWPSPGGYAWLVTADLNGDGKTDLVLGSPDNLDGTARLATALGKGDGTFQAPVASIPAKGAFAYFDWNGDTRMDVLTMTPTGTLTVALGQSNGTFQVARTTGGVNGNSVIVGDATGDLRADAIVLDYASVTVFPGMPDGSFGAPITTLLSGTNAQTLTAADFTGDGKLDLVVSYPLGMSEMLTGNPGAPFSRTGVFSTGKFYRSLALDLDDQGAPELLLPDVAGGGLRIVPFSSKGTPLTAPLYGVLPVGTSYPVYDPRYSSATVGDFDGDGKEDIALSALVANSTTIQVFRGVPLFSLARLSPITVAT